MKVGRRDLLKASLAGAAAAGVGAGGRSAEAAPELRKAVRGPTTICPYCAVGCGVVVGVEDGRVVNTEGDPEHPISRGALCSKGAALSQMVNSPKRLTKPAYRAPGSANWREVEWDWALDEIAQRIKTTRDEHWIETDEQGRTVRRTEAIASVGSAALDNEECSLLVKALRGMGLVYIEHQARI